MRGTYEFLDVKNGSTETVMTGVAVQSAAMLQDGRLFYLQPEPKLGFEQDLWELRTDTKTAKAKAASRLVLKARRTALGDLSASTDGRSVAVIGLIRQTDVYVGELRRPGLQISDMRRLTFDSADDFVHGWTPDSRAVIFESSRNGEFDLFTQRVDQAAAETLFASSENKAMPQLSPDGRYVLYLSWPTNRRGAGDFTLHRVPLRGGHSEAIPVSVPLDEFRCPVRGEHPCVLRTTAGGQYVFDALDPVNGMGGELARVPAYEAPLGDWALSPDGSQLALPNHDAETARIRILNLYRSGDKNHREIEVKNLANIFGVQWDVNAKGFFVHTKTPSDWDLNYVDMNGHAHLLREDCRWGVPSPDGKRLATATDTVIGNVSLVENTGK